MFASLSKHPCHLTCFLVFVCVVAFSARFAVFLDAVAFIVACWHARVCSGGWDGVGWGGVGFGGEMITASDGLTRVRCFGLDMLTLVSDLKKRTTVSHTCPKL